MHCPFAIYTSTAIHNTPSPLGSDQVSANTVAKLSLKATWLAIHAGYDGIEYRMLRSID